jgi:murein L,D-transpeptidase YcbB/YkuD
LPVRIFYWTAYIDERGQLQFHDDVYGFDQLIDGSLRQRRTDIKQPVRTALMSHSPKSETAQNTRLRTRQTRKRAA